MQKTTNIIINCVYGQNLIETTAQRGTLKKLISDTCKKTTFSFKNQLYEQCDGVSIGSSLGSALANIIMTELENVIVRDLIADGTVVLYAHYVDDTLLLIKPENVQKVLMKLNSFDESLNFTFDSFLDEVHF